MSSYKKSSVLLMVTLCFVLLVSACGNQGNSNSTANSSSNATSKSDNATNSTNSNSKDEKIALTLMIAWADDAAAKLEEELIKEHFADKYDITFKTVDNNIAQTIKTTIASGNPVDLAFYWTDAMDAFVDADMALDLTPYLEANNGEWKDTFLDGSLDVATYNGKIYAVPSVPVYPMIEANKELLDQAGVTISDEPTWEEFVTVLATVKEKLGIIPFGLNSSWANWPVRENLMSIWPEEEQVTAWSNGEIPFTDPLVVEAFDEVKNLYDQEYVYPGKGALTVTLEQINVAWKAGKIAFKADVNFLAPQSIKDAGLENVQILSWPRMGPRNNVLAAGANGYMIPANVKHPEASIEVLKFLTSPEVLQHRADNNQPVAVKGVTSNDPNYELYSKDVVKAYSQKEITLLSPKIDEYIANKVPANYIFEGKAALEELEKLRLEAVSAK